MGGWFRKKRLSIYESFETRAENLRYQINDPENWEADQRLEEVSLVLKQYQKRLDKGKELTETDKLVLTKFYTMLHQIASEGLGSNPDFTNLLLKDVQEIYPELGKLTNQLDKFLDGMDFESLAKSIGLTGPDFTTLTVSR